MVLYLLNLMQVHVAQLRREEGQGMVEYALIIALVAVALVGALVILRGNITTLFESIAF